MIKTLPCSGGDAGYIPVWETEIPQTTLQAKEKKVKGTGLCALKGAVPALGERGTPSCETGAHFGFCNLDGGGGLWLENWATFK